MSAILLGKYNSFLLESRAWDNMFHIAFQMLVYE